MGDTTEFWSGVPADLADAIRGAFEPDERAVAAFCPDLDARQSYADGVVVLTDRRLLAAGGGESEVRSWRRDAIARLVSQDRGGLATLEALGPDRLLVRWYATVGRARSAAALADAFESVPADADVEEEEAGEEEVPEAIRREEPPRVGVLFRLLRFARPHAAWLAFGVLLTLATTAAGLIPPLLTWPLVDDILTPYQEGVRTLREAPGLADAERGAQLEALQAAQRGPFTAKVPWYLAGMLGAALAAWGLSWAQGWVLARLSERVSAGLRNRTYAHLQSLSIDYFTAKRTGDLVSRISSDTDRICSFLSDTLMDATTDILMIGGSAIMLFIMDPVLALATLCMLPLVVWVTYWARSHFSDGYARGYKAWGEMTAILADTIPGVRVVKAFAQEQREVERFETANANIVRANDHVNWYWTLIWPLVAMFNQLGLIVAWAFGAWRVWDQQITVGILTAFLAYISRFYSRVEALSRVSGSAQRAAAAAHRIFDVLDRAPSVPEPAHPVHPGRLRGEVEIRNVSFRFGNRKVLDDLSLSIRPGEMIGVVGPTGAGKSTLLNLICRFYDPADGAVLVDGQDIRSFPALEYRRNIGIVLQEPFLFYGTIAENVAYGRPTATRAEIIAAAKAARAHEFILQLPEGYDSIVGERGQTLSGGERQRISIARALLIDPRLLILDEATSSVDTQTEIQIQEALDNLVRGRTTIAIAHRLSTLRNANRLVVFERGRIVETGTHDDLMARGGLYRSLWEAQSREEAERRGAGGIGAVVGPGAPGPVPVA